MGLQAFVETVGILFTLILRTEISSKSSIHAELLRVKEGAAHQSFSLFIHFSSQASLNRQGLPLTLRLTAPPPPPPPG